MSVGAPPQNARWLHGPAPDLLLGSGLIYVPVLAVMILAGPTVQAVAPPGLMPLLLLLVSTPHIGATLLRVYERSEDRRAYTIFAVHATLLITVAFAIALYNVWLGSFLLTLYITVVQWHFSGQNYGIALILLRRRGIEITPILKRNLYLCFLLPCLLFWMMLHAGAQSSEYAPFYTSGTVYSFLPIGIPMPVLVPIVLATLAAYVYVLFSALLQIRAAGPLRDSGPGAALLGTQALWYVLPVLASLGLLPGLQPLTAEGAAYTFLWISLTHSAQYLWITTYYHERREPRFSKFRYWMKAVAAGSALFGLPILVLSPRLFGPLPYDAGLLLILSGGLNLHHVLLDSAIWKLRDGRLAKILIRGSQEAGPIGPQRSWLRPLIYASGALGALLTAGHTLEMEFGVRRAAARNDVARMEQAVQRLGWMGQDSARLLENLGVMLVKQGDGAGAVERLERSVALLDSVPAELNLGAIHEHAGNLDRAERAYAAARRLDPENAQAWHWGGRAARKAGRSAEAAKLLERALALAPGDEEIRRELALARSAPEVGAAGRGTRAGES